MEAPPQLRPLCDAIKNGKIGAADLELAFSVSAATLRGGVPMPDIASRLKSQLSLCGIESKAQVEFLKSCSFLVKQAKNIAAAKLAPRLKPLGFTDEALDALTSAIQVKSTAVAPALAPRPTVASVPKPEPEPVAQDESDDEVDDEDATNTQADIDRMAEELMGEDDALQLPDVAAGGDESSDYSDDDEDDELDIINAFKTGGGDEGGSDDDTDSSSEDEPEDEPEVDDGRDVIAKIPVDDMLVLIRSLETHIVGKNLRKGTSTFRLSLSAG
jgi:hypothetical protein